VQAVMPQLTRQLRALITFIQSNRLPDDRRP
jgi:hypothetical protein